MAARNGPSAAVEAAAKPKPRTSTAGTPHIKPLTSLRFFAALLVVVHHFGMLARSPVSRLFRVALAGYLGVNFFFLLSGFILIYSYLDQRGQMRVSRREFWVARFARIYPVYLVGLVIGTLPYLWTHHSAISRVVTGFAGLTLTQAWIPSAAGQWDGPSWSLSVEAFFYLLFPVIAVRIARLKRPHIYLVLGGCWLICLVLGNAGPAGAYDSNWAWNAILTYNPLARLPEFVMGAVLGQLFINRAAPERPAGAFKIVPPEMVALAAVLGSGLALLFAPRLSDQLVHLGLFDPLFALVIYNIACSRGRLAAFLSLPVMVLLGEASYALYILHYPVLQTMHHVFDPVRSVPLSSPLVCVAYVAVCVALSILSFRLVEQPARRAIKNLLAHPNTQALAYALPSTGRPGRPAS